VHEDLAAFAEYLLTRDVPVASGAVA
jgi:hypothetical protein